MSAAPPKRMSDRVLARPKVAAENLAVGPEIVTLVHLQIPLPVLAKQLRQPIPRHARVHVVNDVEVVVEKQQRQRPASSMMTDRRARAGRAPGVPETSGCAAATARHRRRSIGPERHRRPPDPEQHRQRPSGCARASPSRTRASLPALRQSERRNRRAKQRARQDAPSGQRVVGVEDPAQAQRGSRSQIAGVEVIRFRVVEGVGQLAVQMVCQMGVAEPQVRDDQRQSPERRAACSGGVSRNGWPCMTSCCKRGLHGDGHGGDDDCEQAARTPQAKASPRPRPRR